MLAKAFSTPPDQLYRIGTIAHESDVFLEVDQLPAGATKRPQHPGHLPPGVAMTTLSIPSLERIRAPFLTPPTVHDGEIYAGRRSATVLDPDGARLELLELS